MSIGRPLDVHMPDILVDDSFEDLTGSPGKPKGRKQKERKTKTGDAAAENGAAEDSEGKKKSRFGRAKNEDKAGKDDIAAETGKAAKKAKPDKAGRSGRKAKKEKGILFKILVIAIPVVLVGAFVFEEITYNKLGIRDKTADFLTKAVIWISPEHDSARRTLRIRKEELDKREADIAAREEAQEADYGTRLAALNERREALDVREDELDSRDKKLEQRSLNLDTREQSITDKEIDNTPIYKRHLSDQELEDLQSLSGTFAAMAPDTASEILMRMYDPGDVAAIIYYMSSKNAAAVMSAMDPAYAANLTQLLIAD